MTTETNKQLAELERRLSAGATVRVDRLQAAIDSSGLSISAIADAAHVDRTTIYHLRKGTRRPTPFTAFAVAAVLDLDPLKLVPRPTRAQRESNGAGYRIRIGRTKV